MVVTGGGRGGDLGDRCRFDRPAHLADIFAAFPQGFNARHMWWVQMVMAGDRNVPSMHDDGGLLKDAATGEYPVERYAKLRLESIDGMLRMGPAVYDHAHAEIGLTLEALRPHMPHDAAIALLMHRAVLLQRDGRRGMNGGHLAAECYAEALAVLRALPPCSSDEGKLRRALRVAACFHAAAELHGWHAPQHRGTAAARSKQLLYMTVVAEHLTAVDVAELVSRRERVYYSNDMFMHASRVVGWLYTAACVLKLACRYNLAHRAIVQGPCVRVGCVVRRTTCHATCAPPL